MSNLSLREIAQSQLDSTPVIDGQLIVCLDTGNAYRDTATAHVKIGSDLEVVSDLPLAPLAEKIYYLKPDKLYVFLGGNWTLLNDKTIDLDESIAKLPAGSSTSLNDDVEIITQDTDITQSHYYRRKLVVLWEYIKTKAQDFFAAKNHQHGKADITDFPTSMPASDVYPWAKAATKPSYTKAEVGLGKVDNTADADKTVKRATTAGTADSANSVAWENVKNKPTAFPVEAHNHDDRYYTEAEIDGKLEKKSPTDHTHDLSELISGLSIGNSTTLNDSVQIITQDTNTANQKYYRRPLTVLWDYIKSKADSVYSAIGHNHKIQNLEDYTTRVWDATIVRQADTVLASPQDKDGIATFRKLDKNDVGLENVDNTADKNKNVATAGIATTGVRDYNNANNIIEIGWSGADLDADNLAYVAGYTSDKKIHPASKDGVRMWLGLGDSAYKNTKSRSSKGSTDWTNNATDDAIVPTMSFMAYWDGAYNSNGASNLSYCDRGRFGTIVTKGSGDYAVAGHTHNSVNDIGDGRTTTFAYSKDGMSYGDYSWLAGWNGSELRAVDKNQFAIAGHSHSFINSVGVKNAQTGRNQIYGNVYSYNSNASAHTGMPTTYTSTIGFGQGASGTVEICGEWTGGKGLWSRALRDCCDDWYGWQRIYTENYHPSADVANKANSADYLNFTAGNEINFTGTPTDNTVYFGYRNSTINDYRFCNGSGGLTKVTAASFDGKATSAGTADSATTSNGVKDYNDGNRTIKIGYAGAGLNTSNLTHIAGYTDNGTKIKDVSKDVLTSWIGLGNYLPLSGGLVTGQIQKNTGGSWIGDRDRAVVRSHYPGDWSYGAVVAMATKNGYWTIGNLGGEERLIFNYSTDSNYSAGKNETSQVYLPAQAGTIITSATIGSQAVNRAEYLGNDSAYMRMHWAGKGGQPTWLWGGNDASNMYVWNPSNFSVNYANSAGSAGNGVTASGKTGAGIYYVRFGNGTQMCWGFYIESDHSGSTSFPVAFNNSQYSISLTVTVSSNNAPYITGRSTTSFSYARHGTSYNDVQWIAVGTWK
jgi:hypothetical protein|nr:MAG TPA: putative tail fiber protein [Caudoviricetes sp.]